MSGVCFPPGTPCVPTGFHRNITLPPAIITSTIRRETSAPRMPPHTSCGTWARRLRARSCILSSTGFLALSPSSRWLERHGYHAAAYYGTLDTLKGRLAEGVPVIAFIRIPGDTHYTVVTGYDGQFLYLADSIAALANAEGGWYNRRLRAEEFEDLWSTDRYPMEFVYLAVTP